MANLFGIENGSFVSWLRGPAGKGRESIGRVVEVVPRRGTPGSNYGPWVFKCAEIGSGRYDETFVIADGPYFWWVRLGLMLSVMRCDGWEDVHSAVNQLAHAQALRWPRARCVKALFDALTDEERAIAIDFRRGLLPDVRSAIDLLALERLKTLGFVSRLESGYTPSALLVDMTGSLEEWSRSVGRPLLEPGIDRDTSNRGGRIQLA